jgi:hypothetical protein
MESLSQDKMERRPAIESTCENSKPMRKVMQADNGKRINEASAARIYKIIPRLIERHA